MRVNDLAKEIGKTNKELIALLNAKGIEVTSHMSNVTSEQADMIRGTINADSSDNTEAKKEPTKKKLTAVFRPQNAQKAGRAKSTTALNQTKSGRIIMTKQEMEEEEKKKQEKLLAQERAVKEAREREQAIKEAREKELKEKEAKEKELKQKEQKQISADAAEKKQEAEIKQGYQGNIKMEQSSRVNSNSYQSNRNEAGYQSNRQNQSNRNQNSENRGGSNYQGNRNQSEQRYQGNRNQSEQRYQGNRNQSEQRYQGNRNQSEQRYQGNRNQSEQRYQGNRNQSEQRYQGNRNQSEQRYQGNRNQNNRNNPYQMSKEQLYQNSGEDAYQPKQFKSKAQKKDNKPEAIDATLAKKTTNNKMSKNNFKNQKMDKKHRTEDGPAKGGKVSKHPFIMPVKPKVEVVEEDIKEIIIPETLTIKDLASKLKLQPSAIVKKLFLKGQIVTLNTELTFEQAEEIALEYDVIATMEEKVDVIAELLKEVEDEASTLKSRPPVVCVMGHVDHGKTSLLDAIRKTNVTSHEAGGITQHIGAYMVKVGDEPITFLDTPGHEAFTAMRMRGAQSTDIAILVVAADDGVKPQTVEAISHAKAAGVEIIVAINKVDKPAANIEKVKQELSEYELIPEDWGGSTIFCPVSAKTRDGISNLLEMIILAAEVKELKANPDRKARGIVIEAELDKGKGPVATVLVQKGTLRVGDFVAAGSCSGKVRAMMNDKGQRVKEATPSTPVEILGLDSVPNAGEIFIATENDKEAKSFAATFISEGKNKLIEDTKAKLSLDDLFTQIKAGNIKELPIIIKADVQGSVEAVKQSLTKLSNEEVQVKPIHSGVGAINESDVALAAASNAIIIGFNVRPDITAKASAERENVDLRLYRVIYQAIEDIEAAMNGMLEPVYEEKIIGHAEVRQIFKASGIGNIAGSYILDGKFQRGCKVRISRDGEQIFDGNLASLKRFKDDVKEVATGYECGLVFEKFNDIKELDQVEAYIMVEVPRK